MKKKNNFPEGYIVLIIDSAYIDYNLHTTVKIIASRSIDSFTEPQIDTLQVILFQQQKGIIFRTDESSFKRQASCLT